MKKKKKISILIPCYNEEKGIGKVIDNVPLKKLDHMGFTVEIIVINNNSTDRTAHIAKDRNATVIVEDRKGKGNAVRAGFSAVNPETNYIIMLDGDNTYKASEIPRLIEPLESNFADAIIGSRLGGKLRENSLLPANRAANWVYTFLVRHFYHANTTDVLSGFFAWKKSVVDELKDNIESNGFSLEMEIIIKMVKLGYEVYSVPITYDIREGESKIEAIKDGFIILYTFFKYMNWYKGKQKVRKQNRFQLPLPINYENAE